MKACDVYMRGAISDDGDAWSTFGEELRDRHGQRVPSAYDIVCDNIRFAGEGDAEGPPEELDEKHLLLWLMNMFADCSEAEFVSGVAELCEIYTEVFANGNAHSKAVQQGLRRAPSYRMPVGVP